jgi:hypothetical protein
MTGSNLSSSSTQLDSLSNTTLLPQQVSRLGLQLAFQNMPTESVHNLQTSQVSAADNNNLAAMSPDERKYWEKVCFLFISSNLYLSYLILLIYINSMHLYNNIFALYLL